MSKKNLIVYFSVSNNTKALAEMIHKNIESDIVSIEAVKPYSKLFMFRTIRAKREQSKDKRPEFEELNLKLEDYNNIFIGYPIWWYTLPMIMYSFFDKYDLSGKTIIPFNTHEGSSDGGTYNTIKELEPKAKILEGLPISGGSVKKDNTESLVKDWLKKLKI